MDFKITIFTNDSVWSSYTGTNKMFLEPSHIAMSYIVLYKAIESYEVIWYCIELYSVI